MTAGRPVEFGVADLGIEGLRQLTMKQISDDRGVVREMFRRSAFAVAGIDLAAFAQLNITETWRGAVRGMHAEAMTKLVTVASGEVFAVYVDLRPDSPTVGAVDTVTIEPGVAVIVPNGVANGFQGVAEVSHYVYCFDQEWAPGMPGQAVCPIDPAFAELWPIAIDPRNTAALSAKDRHAPSLADVLAQVERPT